MSEQEQTLLEAAKKVLSHSTCESMLEVGKHMEDSLWDRLRQLKEAVTIAERQENE